MNDDERRIAQLGDKMRKSRSKRLLYVLMRSLMVIESIVWTVMDAVRSVRMKVAEKITK